ncbi:MAG TPA: hypothetical protein VKU02_18125 [Gemmataceae bacterium]|nr:hypothetical protein [Gemmataceae bacterium]
MDYHGTHSGFRSLDHATRNPDPHGCRDERQIAREVAGHVRELIAEVSKVNKENPTLELVHDIARVMLDGGDR